MKVLTSNILLFCYCITTNATEWPKKLWKRQIKGASSLSCLAIGSDGESMLAIARINGQTNQCGLMRKGKFMNLPRVLEPKLSYILILIFLSIVTLHLEQRK